MCFGLRILICFVEYAVDDKAFDRIVLMVHKVIDTRVFDHNCFSISLNVEYDS